MSIKLNQTSNMQVTTEDFRQFTYRKTCKFLDIYTEVYDSEAQSHPKSWLFSFK